MDCLRVSSSLLMKKARMQSVRPYRFFPKPTSMAGHSKCFIAPRVVSRLTIPKSSGRMLIGLQMWSCMKQRTGSQRKLVISSGLIVIWGEAYRQKIAAYANRELVGLLQAVKQFLRMPIRSDSDNFSPAYYEVSLTAVWKMVSPASHFPPGRQTSPEQAFPSVTLYRSKIQVLRMASIVLLLGVMLDPCLRMMETAQNLSYFLGWV